MHNLEGEWQILCGSEEILEPLNKDNIGWLPEGEGDELCYTRLVGTEIHIGDPEEGVSCHIAEVFSPSDAPVIAAAPDLYAACKATLSLIYELNQQCEQTQIVRDKCLAALHKAETDKPKWKPIEPEKSSKVLQRITNARLIAAAPKLLAACKVAFKQEEDKAADLAYKAGLGAGEWEAFLSRIGIQLQAVIAEAEKEVAE